MVSARPALTAGGTDVERRVEARTAVETIDQRHRSSRHSVPASLIRAVAVADVSEEARLECLLDTRWNVRLTPDLIRREWRRIVRESTAPRRLAERVHALDDDPVLVLEEIARPVLLRRIVRNRFDFDRTIHGEALRRLQQVRQSVLTDGPDPAPKGSRGRELTLELADLAGSIPLIPGAVGEVREDRGGFRFDVVIGIDGDRVRVVRYFESKISWGAWWSEARNGYDADPAPLPPSTVGPGLPVTFVELREPAGGCLSGADDDWSEIASGALDERKHHTAVWTGAELIVWGGEPFPTGGQLDSGARYDPALDAWSEVSRVGAPSPRAFHSAVWTGDEMIVWGGRSDTDLDAGRGGGRYDPLTDSWTPLADAPISRNAHTAVWSGSEMIVWGGNGNDPTGARFDPATSQWTTTSTTFAPLPRVGHTAIWSGEEMIVWGGRDPAGGTTYGDGASYFPALDVWQRLPLIDAPAARRDHTAVWTGEEMIVWGGRDSSVVPSVTYGDGARFDPMTWHWGTMSAVDAPPPAAGHVAVWTGSRMLIHDWDGGGRYDPELDSWSASAPPPIPVDAPGVWSGTELLLWSGARGARYDPAGDQWSVVAGPAPLQARRDHTAVWTGSEMIVWGGRLSDLAFGDGARYDPALDEWTPVATAGAPSARWSHTAVWTGQKVIVWGGAGLDPGDASSGGRYDPMLDSWSPTSLVDAPEGREGHVAVWTGNEMIVWGGLGGSVPGGRYDPASDSWSSTSLAGAPDSRRDLAAVWTGTEMLVWGGRVGSTALDTGGRYDPALDAWAPMTATDPPQARWGYGAVWTGERMLTWGGRDAGAPADPSVVGSYDPVADGWSLAATNDPPAARDGHTAVWTGAEMLVWGGVVNTLEGTGGRYDPTSGAWRPTSPVQAPSGRAGHTAVWTGERMIVWGGESWAGEVASGGLYAAALDPDGDGVVDACDCLPDDGSAFAVPSEVAGLVWNGAGTVLAWEPVDAGTGTVYDVAGGRTDEWPVGTGAAEICVATGVSDPSAVPAVGPPAGEGSYYLVRARNACGAGGYGTTSDGSPRTIATCP